MNLEQTLEKIVRAAYEELRIVRKRAEQKTAARDSWQGLSRSSNRCRSAGPLRTPGPSVT